MKRPDWSLTEAAAQTQVSRTTLKRALDAQKFPNAYKDSRGTWKIPVTDLIAAGMGPKSAVEGIAPSASQIKNAGDQGELENLRNELRVLRAKLEASEAIAEAHERRADSAERALRLLEAPRPNWVTDLGQNQATSASELGQPKNTQVNAGSPQTSDMGQGPSSNLDHDLDQGGPIRRWWRGLTRR